MEHDLNSRMAAEELNENARAKFQRLKRFIDACVDLRSALTVLASKDFSSTQQNGVLFIDDRPDLIEKDLRCIFSSFLPDLELMVWNPEDLASNNPLASLMLAKQPVSSVVRMIRASRFITALL